MKKKKHVVGLRWFQCPDCGALLTAPKHRGRTDNGHVKNMWCFKCNGDKPFIQVDVDRARA